MRKLSTKERYTTRQYMKADAPCRAYNDVQRAFALKLEKEKDVRLFKMNVPIGCDEIEPSSSWQPKEPFMTDFVIEYAQSLAVRETVLRRELCKVSVLEKLDYSRRFWRQQGVTDWGIVIEKGSESCAE